MHDGYSDPMDLKVEQPYAVHQQHHQVQSDHEFRHEQMMDLPGGLLSRTSPSTEYHQFGFMPPGESVYHRPFQPQFSPVPPLPPLNVDAATLWPSQITNPTGYLPPPISLPVHRPIAPFAHSMLARNPPPRVSSRSMHHGNTARKVLSDKDRRRMCKYHEANPTVKQTEIGAIFGVERSTVSKVLRNKDKFLIPEDGDRSPVKRARGKFPDVERTLLNWIKNRMAEGLPTNDDLIKEEARKFASTLGGTESQSTVNDPIWLEMFKTNYDLPGAKPRESYKASEPEEEISPRSKSGSQTPNAVSPRGEWDRIPTSSTTISDTSQVKSPDTYYDSSSAWSHQASQSRVSLSSYLSDGTLASSDNSFGGSAAGVRSPSSPYFSPVSSCGPSPAMAAPKATRLPPLAPASFSRRRQTFPLVGLEIAPDASDPGKTGESTPSAQTISPLDIVDPSQASKASLKAIANDSNLSPLSMAPPNLPASSSSPTAPPSRDEARDALRVLMEYIRNCPDGLIDPHDYIVIGKLMQMLKLDTPELTLPGGMHSIGIDASSGATVERADGIFPTGRKRSEQSLS